MTNYDELIDVSHWQGKIDWKKVKNDGVKGVYIKATEGSRNGSAYVDAEMVRNYTGAKAQGLEVGFYHYAKFIDVPDAIEEAKWFVNHIQGLDFTLPPMLDLEENKCKNDTVMNQGAKAFLSYVEQNLGSAGLYSFGAFFETHVDKKLLNDYAYWHARYNDKPVNVKLENIFMWQYTDKGKVNGISGFVDRNKAGGKFFTVNKKKTTTKKKTNPVVEKPPSKKPYKIQFGDSLSLIAKKNKTTIKKLLQMNPSIKDKDKIFSGQSIWVPRK